MHLYDTLLINSLQIKVSHETEDASARVIQGDINGDHIIDIFDALALSGAFGPEPGQLNWNPNADLLGDGIVDIFDALVLAGNFGKTV